MKQEPANTPLPTMEVDDTRIDIDRLESEAQTHDCPRNDTEKDKSVVSGSSATREEAGKLRLPLPGLPFENGTIMRQLC
jgi:hypothetical protein